MYTFKITDGNGKVEEYNHITKVIYCTVGDDLHTKENVFEGDVIFEHTYPTSYDLHLYSENEAFTISKKNISIIQVIKEN